MSIGKSFEFMRKVVAMLKIIKKCMIIKEPFLPKNFKFITNEYINWVNAQTKQKK